MKNYADLIDVPRSFAGAEPEREARIHDEIIVDAYGDEEVTSSWYYYLEETLQFPFTAMVQTHRYRPRTGGIATSSSQVELLGMAPLSRCGYHQMWVMGVLGLQRETPVHFFLGDLVMIEPDEDREAALSDWLYWRRDQPAELWEWGRR